MSQLSFQGVAGQDDVFTNSHLLCRLQFVLQRRDLLLQTLNFRLFDSQRDLKKVIINN